MSSVEQRIHQSRTSDNDPSVAMEAGATRAALLADHKAVCVDMRTVARTMGDRFEQEIEECVTAAHRPASLRIHTGAPLSIFDPAAWVACLVLFFYGGNAPNLERPVNISWRQLFRYLMNREELDYHLEEDELRATLAFVQIGSFQVHQTLPWESAPVSLSVGFAKSSAPASCRAGARVGKLVTVQFSQGVSNSLRVQRAASERPRVLQSLHILTQLYASSRRVVHRCPEHFVILLDVTQAGSSSRRDAGLCRVASGLECSSTCSSESPSSSTSDSDPNPASREDWCSRLCSIDSRNKLRKPASSASRGPNKIKTRVTAAQKPRM